MIILKRSFEEIINNLKDSIATYSYYVDFDKVYSHVSDVEKHLNLLNYLIGKENIEEEFSNLITEYPQVLKVLPLLLAVRDGNIKIIDGEFICYDFNNMNQDMDSYLKLFRETGLEKLFKEKKITNLVDYVIGVEVGLDTNARKNRTGKQMETIVEGYIKKIPGIDYLSQANLDMIINHYDAYYLNDLNLNLKERSNKRFDFVFKNRKGKLIFIETNYYSGGGSKLNETARSYSKLNRDIKNISNVEFVWITDGKGWLTTKNNLKEAYNEIEHLYTIEDLENGVLNKLY